MCYSKNPTFRKKKFGSTIVHDNAKFLYPTEAYGIASSAAA
jgi:hypothetical protein